jgi:hypothetical protein
MTDLPEEGRGEGEPRGGSGDVGSQGQPKGERPAKKRLLTPSRIVLFVLVIVAAAVFTFEFRALSAFNRTVQDLARAWETGEETGKGMYRADLEKLIHGSPLKERDAETGTETFTWRGIRAHRLEVQYGSADLVSSFKTLRGGK